MAEIEFERKSRLTRQQAGERLIALGKSLQGGSKSKFEHDGDSIQFSVGAEIAWEFELNIDGDEVELEIELKWSNRKSAAPSKPAAPAKRTAAAKRPAKRAKTAKRTAAAKRPAKRSKTAKRPAARKRAKRA
jgi:amphi-Trp domain-containing protein